MKKILLLLSLISFSALANAEEDKWISIGEFENGNVLVANVSSATPLISPEKIPLLAMAVAFVKKGETTAPRQGDPNWAVVVTSAESCLNGKGKVLARQQDADKKWQTVWDKEWEMNGDSPADKVASTLCSLVSSKTKKNEIISKFI